MVERTRKNRAEPFIDEMSERLVVLGLGSNRPWNSMNCRSILKEAISALGVVLSGLRQAPFYETEPVPKSDQDNFFNTAVSGFYDASPHGLLAEINAIEARFGRDRAKETRWGPRSLDIDILLFGGLVLCAPDLVIPHPRLAERRFALEPLLELLPDAASPETGVLYREICGALPDQGVRPAAPRFTESRFAAR